MPKHKRCARGGRVGFDTNLVEVALASMPIAKWDGWASYGGRNMILRVALEEGLCALASHCESGASLDPCAFRLEVVADSPGHRLKTHSQLRAVDNLCSALAR